MSTQFDSHAILVKHYVEQISKQYRWNKIVQEASQNTERDEFGDTFGRVRLGSTLGVYPSGKIYTFWTSNQTSSDVRRDDAFSDALSLIAKKHNGFIEYEDDDVFFVLPCLDQDSTAEDEMDDAE